MSRLYTHCPRGVSKHLNEREHTLKFTCYRLNAVTQKAGRASQGAQIEKNLESVWALFDMYTDIMMSKCLYGMCSVGEID